MFNNIYSHLQPGVYRIIKLNNTNNNTLNLPNYTLEYVSNKLTVPEKIYGDTFQHAVRIWNDYALGDKSTGCLLLGDKGTGKTLLGSIISNIAIDNHLPVIMVTEIQATTELIQFLSQLNKCVLLLDEFVKNINYDMQSIMLTMFSDLINTRKLFIITENSDRYLQSYLLDRPGRVKYRLDFDKLSIKTFEDYTREFIKNKSFLEELTELYHSAIEFSFDQLSGIVKEHLNYPNDTLDDLLNILNVKSLRKTAYLQIVKVIDLENIERKLSPDLRDPKGIPLNDFKHAIAGTFIYIRDTETNNVVAELLVRYRDLKQITDKNYSVTIKDKEINAELHLEKVYI